MTDLFEMLKSLAKRPQMYVGKASFATVKAYLNGLAGGLSFAGIEYTLDDYNAAAEARGWDPRGNIGIERDFIRKGQSDAEMIQALVAVEADAYARALARRNERQ